MTLFGAGGLAIAPLCVPVVAQNGQRLTTILSAGEVVGSGDADSSASMSLDISPASGRLCWFVRAAGLAPATAIHVHFARSGEQGPAVITMPGARLNGCLSVSRALARAILASPSDYAADIHTADHPAGAIRGQFN